ncbi:hypothetical protein [Methylorubrum extorquens]|uniref:hypothetical protein n=1 Tax=Methylorubrum extorquens TaxID=408 RepID=UPI0022379A0D|nr:hypothetical protein [Methylorubrum extorquens]UYW35273.1 hypothetical protein OKB92_05870 [Methylorubrum extorquens]
MEGAGPEDIICPLSLDTVGPAKLMHHLQVSDHAEDAGKKVYSGSEILSVLELPHSYDQQITSIFATQPEGFAKSAHCMMHFVKVVGVTIQVLCNVMRRRAHVLITENILLYVLTYCSRWFGDFPIRQFSTRCAWARREGMLTAGLMRVLGPM